MKKLRLYLDTSVISHLDAPDVPEKEADTKRLWERIKAEEFEVVISDLTIVEIEAAPEHKRSFMQSMIADISSIYVERNNEAKRMSDLYVAVGGLPPKSKDDALHIAIATISNRDVILSWNFKHIVNMRAMVAVDASNTREGYKSIRILAPNMILSEEE